MCNVAANDSRFRNEVESDFHGAGGRQWAVYGHTEGADLCRPVRIFYVGNPTVASRMGEAIGKAGLRKCVRWRRGVYGLII